MASGVERPWGIAFLPDSRLLVTERPGRLCIIEPGRGIVTQIREYSAEQAALTASKQEATKRVQYLLVQGRKLSTVLRAIIREHYGNRSEKLAEFGMQPLRTRPRNPENPLPDPE